MEGPLTVGVGAHQASHGVVEEAQQAGHCQADVGVGGPQVQGGEPGELHLQGILRGHFHVRHLGRAMRSKGRVTTEISLPHSDQQTQMETRNVLHNDSHIKPSGSVVKCQSHSDFKNTGITF